MKTGDTEILNLDAEKWKFVEKTTFFSQIFYNLIDSVGGKPKEVFPVIVPDPSDPRFHKSAEEEIRGLLERGS